LHSCLSQINVLDDTVESWSEDKWCHDLSHVKRHGTEGLDHNLSRILQLPGSEDKLQAGKEQEAMGDTAMDR
jgi:hypothetical protein